MLESHLGDCRVLSMTTVTLEIPDDLAARFKIEPSRLPVLIREALEARLGKRAEPTGLTRQSPPVYQEMLDFLAARPSQQQIIDFRISADAQERLEELVDRNREESLSHDEHTELETYLQFSHLLARLKANARSDQSLTE